MPRYAEVFNALGRWAYPLATLMPMHFRFCAKLPRGISHAGDLREPLERLWAAPPRCSRCSQLPRHALGPVDLGSASYGLLLRRRFTT